MGGTWDDIFETADKEQFVGREQELALLQRELVDLLLLSVTRGELSEAQNQLAQLCSEQLQAIETGKLTDGLVLFERLRQEPLAKSAWVVALIYCSQGYLRLNRYSEAEANLSQAIELDEKIAPAFASRGLIYMQMGQHQTALADFDRAIELDEKEAWAIARRGENYREMRRYEAALADLDRVLALAPANDWYWYNRGLTRLALGSSDEARIDLVQAINLVQPDYTINPEAWGNTFNLAIYHLVLEQVVEAGRIYREALAASAPALHVREAIIDLEELLQLFPEHVQAKRMRSMLQAHLDEMDQAT